jgi:hypothetical protein
MIGILYRVMIMNDSKFYELIKSIVKSELSKQGVVGNWHLGKVDQVISSKKLKVFIDGGTVSQTVSCNPSITFAVNDEVWVVYVNGNSKDKFALCKRAV